MRPHDAFGQVMIRSLGERGYALRGLTAFPDLPSQAARYVGLGYAAASAADLNEIYYRVLPRADVLRAERLELFDELEEWHLMSAHYCVALAVNDAPAEAAPPAEKVPTVHAFAVPTPWPAGQK